MLVQQIGQGLPPQSPRSPFVQNMYMVRIGVRLQKNTIPRVGLRREVWGGIFTRKTSLQYTKQINRGKQRTMVTGLSFVSVFLAQNCARG